MAVDLGLSTARLLTAIDTHEAAPDASALASACDEAKQAGETALLEADTLTTLPNADPLTWFPELRRDITDYQALHGADYENASLAALAKLQAQVILAGDKVAQIFAASAVQNRLAALQNDNLDYATIQTVKKLRTDLAALRASVMPQNIREAPELAKKTKERGRALILLAAQTKHKLGQQRAQAVPGMAL